MKISRKAFLTAAASLCMVTSVQAQSVFEQLIPRDPLVVKKEQEEWERTRPQREAEERRRNAVEAAKLNNICPIYKSVRPSCATAGEFRSIIYKSCMNIQMNNTYNESDDVKCFGR